MVGWLVGEEGRSGSGSGFSSLGVQGVYPLVEGQNTQHTSMCGCLSVFMSGGDIS